MQVKITSNFYKSGYNNLPQKVSEKGEKEKTGRKNFTYSP